MFLIKRETVRGGREGGREKGREERVVEQNTDPDYRTNHDRRTPL